MRSALLALAALFGLSVLMWAALAAGLPAAGVGLGAIAVMVAALLWALRGVFPLHAHTPPH